MFIGKGIASKLQARFNLKTNQPQSDSWRLNDYVQAVTDINDVVRAQRFVYDLTTPAGTGDRYGLIVPQRKRYSIHLVGVDGAATCLIDAISVSNGLNVALRFAYQTPASTLRYYLPHPLIMPSGWQIGAHVSTYSAGDLLIEYIYEEEDAE